MSATVCQSHTPALATTMSSRPMRSTVCAISCLRRGGSVTSAAISAARRPSTSISCDAALALVGHREVVDDDVGAVPREHARDAAADRAVARGARDDGDLAGERHSQGDLDLAVDDRHVVGAQADLGPGHALTRRHVELEPVPGAGDDLALVAPGQLPAGRVTVDERARTSSRRTAGHAGAGRGSAARAASRRC